MDFGQFGVWGRRDNARFSKCVTVLKKKWQEIAEKSAIMGALTLYLDFINLFLFILQFMGRRD